MLLLLLVCFVISSSLGVVSPFSDPSLIISQRLWLISYLVLRESRQSEGIYIGRGLRRDDVTLYFRLKWRLNCFEVRETWQNKTQCIQV